MSKRENVKQIRPAPRRRALSPGDRAVIHFGTSAVVVEVVEDRGPVGSRGRHLMRVRRLDGDTVEPESTFEVAAEELTPVRNGT
jgi:hypothetical protein